MLLVQGPEAVDSTRVSPGIAGLLGAGLLLVAFGALIAGVGVLRMRPWAWRLSWVIPIVFVLDGALNGYLLFGRPGDRGTVVNIIFAGLIFGALWLGRGAQPPDGSTGSRRRAA